jgi:hypothetical protein
MGCPATWEPVQSSLNDTTGALLQETNGGYEVLDYMVDFLTEQDLKIPEAMRDAAERHAAAGELLDVALQAVRHQREDRAEAAWQRARDNPIAMYNLGMLHERRGNLREAERWWEVAAEEGDPDAMYRLGMLLLKQGARQDGEHWMRQAAKAAGRPTADKRADVRVHSADARIAFSGAATDAQQQLLTAALRGYMACLEQLDAPLGPVPTVHISPSTDITYPHGAQRRLFMGSWLADYPDALLHEYSHWVLDSLVLDTRETWTDDIMDVESGLAYYLPCSFMNSPSITFLDLRAPSRVPPQLGPEHRVGLRWAGALWEVRGRLGRQALDRPLLEHVACHVPRRRRPGRIRHPPRRAARGRHRTVGQAVHARGAGPRRAAEALIQREAHRSGRAAGDHRLVGAGGDAWSPNVQ